MNDDARPRRISVVVKRTGDYWVLVPEESGDVVVINKTGNLVFRQCDGSRSQIDIAQTIAEAVGVNVEVVKNDVAAFIAHLESAGILAW